MKTDWKCLCLWGGLWMLLLSSSQGAVHIKNLSWEQRWPWNGLVDITFSIECPDRNWDGTPADIRMSFIGYDRDHKRKIRMHSVSGDGGETVLHAGGPYHVVWNSDEDYPGFHSTAFRIRGMAAIIQKPLAPGQKQFLVIDLSGGPGAEFYPFRFSDTGPEVSGDVCRTTELWFRSIPSGSFSMGSPEGEIGRDAGEDQHKVELIKPFYVGVFEVTQKQWELVTGTDPSWAKGPCRPVEHVSYEDLRGSGLQAGAGWPNFEYTVDAGSFLGRLQERTRLNLDLPTEAQWEYACRAGTATALNSGKDLTEPGGISPVLNEVGRYQENHQDGKGVYADCHTRVGSYLPNSWGLYDMHGNVFEWCLDWWENWKNIGSQRDPQGARKGQKRICRGGSWASNAGACRSAARLAVAPGVRGDDGRYGVRLVCNP